MKRQRIITNRDYNKLLLKYEALLKHCEELKAAVNEVKQVQELVASFRSETTNSMNQLTFSTMKLVKMNDRLKALLVQKDEQLKKYMAIAEQYRQLNRLFYPGGKASMS